MLRSFIKAEIRTHHFLKCSGAISTFCIAFMGPKTLKISILDVINLVGKESKTFKSQLILCNEGFLHFMFNSVGASLRVNKNNLIKVNKAFIFLTILNNYVGIIRCLPGKKVQKTSEINPK